MIHWEKQKPHDGSFLEEHLVLEGSLFLSLSAHLQVDRLTATATALMVQVVSTQTVCCSLTARSKPRRHGCNDIPKSKAEQIELRPTTHLPLQGL
jgi:hypothetical protein